MTSPGSRVSTSCSDRYTWVPLHLILCPLWVTVVSMETALVSTGLVAEVWHWIFPHFACLSGDKHIFYWVRRNWLLLCCRGTKAYSNVTHRQSKHFPQKIELLVREVQIDSENHLYWDVLNCLLLVKSRFYGRGSSHKSNDVTTSPGKLFHWFVYLNLLLLTWLPSR